MILPDKIKEKLIAYYKNDITDIHLNNKINDLISTLNEKPEDMVQMAFNQLLKYSNNFGIGLIQETYNYIERHTWTTNQVCECLKISRRQIHYYIRKELLHPHKIVGFPSRFDKKECIKLKQRKIIKKNVIFN